MKPDRVFLPYPEEKMNKYAGINTICETLRSAYRAIDRSDMDEAKLNIRVAVTMAKAMSKKLTEYNSKFTEDFFSE
jgi:hypothetical protein